MFAAEIGQDVCETGDIKNCASLKSNAEKTAYKWHWPSYLFKSNAEQ